MEEYVRQVNTNIELSQEIERLNSIIKEAIEYIENEDIDVCTIRYNDIQDVKQQLLEILDKVEKENDIEFDVLKALNTDLDDDVEMG